jgi:hypothetical protein
VTEIEAANRRNTDGTCRVLDAPPHGSRTGMRLICLSCGSAAGLEIHDDEFRCETRGSATDPVLPLQVPGSTRLS